MNGFPRMMFFMSTLPTQEKKMYAFEEINDILNACADEGILEPMVEPIDENTCHPLDWAEVVGVDIFDEIYP